MSHDNPSYVFEDGYLDLFPMDYEYLDRRGVVTIDIDENSHVTLICHKVERTRCFNKFYILATNFTRGAYTEMHSLHIPERNAIGINIKGDYVTFRHIKLPKLMRDKVMWALGARRKNKCNSLEEFDNYVNSNTFEHGAIVRTIGKFHGIFVRGENGRFDRDLSRCYVEGYPTREETLSVLEYAYDLSGGPFSSCARIKYVIDNITKKEDK